MDSVYTTENNDVWQEFFNFPSELFAEEPNLEGLGGEVFEQTSPSTWDAASWDFFPHNGTFSSTDSTDSQEDVKPVLLPAADFVFQSGNKTETLAERLAPLPPAEVVTTGDAATSSTQPISLPMTYEAVMKLLRSEDPPKSDVTSHVDEVFKKGKRKMPDVDLDAISDPEERKKQKRMAKNRRTAAVSRLRKKARLDGLEQQIESLQRENQKLKSVLAQFLSNGSHLAPSFDELAMLMTVLRILVIMQSMVVPAVHVPMTLWNIIRRPSRLELLVSRERFSEQHYTRHSAAEWQRMGVT